VDKRLLDGDRGGGDFQLAAEFVDRYGKLVADAGLYYQLTPQILAHATFNRILKVTVVKAIKNETLHRLKYTLQLRDVAFFS
jgi:hypothetical protein